jgi:Calcineurin-like phosphoesterase
MQPNVQRDMWKRVRAGIAALCAVIVGMAVALCLACPAHAGDAAPRPGEFPAMWVQLGPTGVALARLVTTQASCPRITLGAQAQPMHVRAQPSAPEFPVLVCEAVIPPGTTAAAVEGRPLPLPKSNSQRIVVVGDAGCRLKPGVAFQACNDPQAWPFAHIARSAAAYQPDLVIHVGDYLYREHACPAGDAGCAASPWGDNWDTWWADFFAPAAELLRTAPWLMTRGNHEGCTRAGPGWFRLLDPQLPVVGCQEYTPPYAVPLGAVQLLVLDSANAPDETAPAALVALYQAQFAALREAATAASWLVTHRPLWGIGRPDEVVERDKVITLNATLQAASAKTLASGIQLVLSGHIHFFQALSFGNGWPPQLIVGNSGTALIPGLGAPLEGMALAGTHVAHGMTIDRFGFLTLERAATEWTAIARDVQGQRMTSCRLAAASATCLP